METDIKKIRNNIINYDLNNLRNELLHANIPEETGAMKNRIIMAMKRAPQGINILIDDDIVSYNDLGTSPHDIPNAFGYGPDFGIGGRFNGFFHPGSTKNMGFVDRVIVSKILSYYVRKGGKIEW